MHAILYLENMRVYLVFYAAAGISRMNTNNIYICSKIPLTGNIGTNALKHN